MLSNSLNLSKFWTTVIVYSCRTTVEPFPHHKVSYFLIIPTPNHRHSLFCLVLQSLSHVCMTAAHQASLLSTISQSLLRFISMELEMLYNHFILCQPLLFPPSIFPSISIFSNESALHTRWPEYWSFSISPSNEYSGLISFRID